MALARGWRARVLLATAAGMTVAFALAWVRPPSYVSSAYVAVGRAYLPAALAYVESDAFRQLMGIELGVPTTATAGTVTIEANRLGGWLSIEVRGRDAPGAARAANAIAAILTDSGPAPARLLVGAQPATSPVAAIPQGLALVGGGLAIAVAGLIEVVAGAARRVVRNATDAAELADAPALSMSDLALTGGDTGIGTILYDSLRFDANPSDVLVAAPSSQQAAAVAALVARPLRANGRNVDAAPAPAAVPSHRHLHTPGGPGERRDMIWELPTLDPHLVGSWAGATHRSILAVNVGDTPSERLRGAAQAIKAIGRSVSAVVVAERNERDGVTPEDCEWVVMD